MLHALTHDRKTKAEASSQSKPLSEQEQLTPLPDWRGRSQRENLAVLQKSYGNQAVLRMMGRSQPAALPMQTKLTVNQPGDQYEQEADRVADQVMRMPAPKIQRVCPECEEELQRQPVEEEEKKKEEEETLQTKPLAESITPLIQRQTEPMEEEEEETLQTKTTSGEPPTVSSSLQNRITALRGGGQPLPPSERAFFEPRFGADFSQVRIHADSQAAETASAVNARAFTLGRDVVFGAGQYQPRSSEGQRLLAHELTHVIQQKTTLQSKFSPPKDEVLPPKNRFVKASSYRIKSTIQRAMKFEFQTSNYVWNIDKGGNPEPIGRKLGRYGYTESGDEPAYLAVGKQGYPEVKVGDLVKAKKGDFDKQKESQYIITERVIKDPKGKFKLNDVPVEFSRVSTVDNANKPEMKGKYNRGIYEFIYLDASGKQLNIHRDPTGNFQYGRIKMKVARERGKKRGTKSEVVKEGTAIELQSEAKGFLEFETPKWFRTWCGLRLRVKEAVDMTKKISNSTELTDNKTNNEIKKKINNKIPKLIANGKRYKEHAKMGRIVEWPTSFKTDLPLKGGRLVVEIVDKDWKAYIQPSEGISLTQFELLLKEHRPSEEVERTSQYAKGILKEAKVSPEKAPSLYSFLQIISYYIEYGQLKDITREPTNKPGPAKWAFPLMSRTSFSSIYTLLLSQEEQKVFKELVNSKKIFPVLNRVNPKLALNESSRFFKFGHGGKRDQPLTINTWLKSIFQGGQYIGKVRRDLLSPPEGGSAAMGRFDVETEPGKKDTNLVKIEVRLTKGNSQPADQWVEYAKNIFKNAATNRKRKDGTELLYSDNCSDTYFEQKKKEAESAKKAKSLFRMHMLPSHTSPHPKP